MILDDFFCCFNLPMKHALKMGPKSSGKMLDVSIANGFLRVDWPENTLFASLNGFKRLLLRRDECPEVWLNGEMADCANFFAVWNDWLKNDCLLRIGGISGRAERFLIRDLDGVRRRFEIESRW